MVVILGGIPANAVAQEATDPNAAPGQALILPSQSSVYNQNSVFLPNAPAVTGQDIVRGADGSSCQAAVANGGPYLDVGVIGSQDVFDRGTASLYTRVVVPLGRRAKRVDCTRLYELEITRMRMELELLRMGTMVPTQGQGPDLIAAAVSRNSPPTQPPTARQEPPAAAELFVLAAAPATEPPPAPKPPPAPIAEAPPPVKATPSKRTGTHFAQVGAFSTADRAHQHLDTITDHLGQVPYPAEVTPASGISPPLFRARFGPMNEAEATSFCARAGDPCLVTDA